LVTPVKAQDTPGLGPYHLLRQLADGGVFLAERPGGQPVVVRAIAAELAANPRFRAEVAAAREVSPAFATPVVDADLDTAAPWLATAYVSGPSLAETVREQGPLPVSTVLGLAAGLAEGLRDMYAVDLVHRNLRPSNVVLTPDGPRLTGFGTWNATDVPGMNPGFLSPEQVLAGDVGSASDIFSLGAVLAFAATGHGPFGSGSSAALMYRLVNSPAQLDDVGAELRTVVASCLEKRPGDRPTASDLLAVLAAIRPQGAGRSWWQAGGPVPRPAPAGGSAAPPPALASGSAGGRRGRPRSLTPVLVTASLLAAVVVGVLALTGTLFPAGGGHIGPQAGTIVAAAGHDSPAAGDSVPSGAAGVAPVSSPGSGVFVPSGRSDGVTPSTLGGSITAALVSLPHSVAAPPSSAALARPAPSGSGSAAPAKSASASASAPSSSSASATAPSSSSAAPAPSSSGAPAPSSSAPSSPASSSSGSSSSSASPAPAPSSSAPSSPAVPSSAAPSSAAPSSAAPSSASASASASSS
jgi:hypothetical protein